MKPGALINAHRAGNNGLTKSLMGAMKRKKASKKVAKGTKQKFSIAQGSPAEMRSGSFTPGAWSNIHMHPPGSVVSVRPPASQPAGTVFRKTKKHKGKKARKNKSGAMRKGKRSKKKSK